MKVCHFEKKTSNVCFTVEQDKVTTNCRWGDCQTHMTLSEFCYEFCYLFQLQMSWCQKIEFSRNAQSWQNWHFCIALTLKIR